MNKKLHFTLLLPIIMGLILSACSSGTGTADLGGTSWKLESYGPASDQTPAVEGIETSVKFGTDGQVSGNLGCNSFGGDYKQAGSQLTFGPIMSTLMACPEAQMSQESISLSILNGTVDFQLNADRLTIGSTTGDQIVLVRQ